MKIHNYADSVPFWIAIDITGGGVEWQLAFLRRNDIDEREIVYPLAEFDDYWDAEHFAQYDQVPVLFAEDTKEVRQALEIIAYGDKPDQIDPQAIADETLEAIFLPNVQEQVSPPDAAQTQQQKGN